MSTEKSMWHRILDFLERTSFPVEPRDSEAMSEAAALAVTRYEFILPELMAVEDDRQRFGRNRKPLLER